MFAKISNDFIDHTRDYMQFKSNIVLDSYYSNQRKVGSSFCEYIIIPGKGYQKDVPTNTLSDRGYQEQSPESTEPTR